MNESHTSVIPAVPEPPPVFVDGTGRRRRRVRRLAYGLGLLGLSYPALAVLGLAGGPVEPRTVLPLPDQVVEIQEILPAASPTVTAPSPDRQQATATGTPPSGPRRSPSTRPPRRSTTSSGPPPAAAPKTDITTPPTSPDPTETSSPSGIAPTEPAF